jgi:ribonuclease VapC
LIVVDASAVVAIGDLESDAPDYLAALSAATDAVICGVNAVEAGIVLIRRGRLESAADVEKWLARLGVDVDNSTVESAAVLAAYTTYGRGFHRARLNLGDCFAYALAKQLDAPLLYKGADFALTDVRSALQPT